MHCLSLQVPNRGRRTERGAGAGGDESDGLTLCVCPSSSFSSAWLTQARFSCSPGGKGGLSLSLSLPVLISPPHVTLQSLHSPSLCPSILNSAFSPTFCRYPRITPSVTLLNNSFCHSGLFHLSSSAFPRRTQSFSSQNKSSDILPANVKESYRVCYSKHCSIKAAQFLWFRV